MHYELLSPKSHQQIVFNFQNGQVIYFSLLDPRFAYYFLLELDATLPSVLQTDHWSSWKLIISVLTALKPLTHLYCHMLYMSHHKPLLHTHEPSHKSGMYSAR